MSTASVEPMQAEEMPSVNASSRQIVRNTSTSYLSTGVGILAGLVITPLLVRHLGSEQFGLWVLLSSVISQTILLELGISTTVVKRVAECLASNDSKRLDVLLGTSQCLFCVVAVLVVIASTIVAIFVGQLFHLSASSVTIARSALIILGINQAAVFAGITQAAVIIGAGRLDLANQVGTVVTILTMSGNLICVLAGAGVIGLTFVTLLGSLFTVFVTHRILRRQFRGIRLAPQRATWPMGKELIKFGSRNAVVALSGSLSQGADTIILAALLPVSAVGQYAIASRLANLLRSLAMKPIEVLMPTYSHSHALGENERLGRMFVRSITVSLALLIPAVIGVCVFGKEIIQLWVGKNHDASYPIAVVLVLALVLQIPGLASFTILTGTERNVFLMKASITGATGNFLLSIALTSMLGPIGVALGTLIAVIAVEAVLLPFWVCREFRFGFGWYLRGGLLPLARPALCATAVALVLHHVTLLTRGAWPLVCLAVVGSVFLGTMWNSDLGLQVRELVERKLSMVLKSRKGTPANEAQPAGAAAAASPGSRRKLGINPSNM